MHGQAEKRNRPSAQPVDHIIPSAASNSGFMFTCPGYWIVFATVCLFGEVSSFDLCPVDTDHHRAQHREIMPNMASMPGSIKTSAT